MTPLFCCKVVSEEVNKSRECECFWAGFNRRHVLTLWGRSWSGNIPAILVCIICTKRRLNAYHTKPLLLFGQPGGELCGYPHGRLLFKFGEDPPVLCPQQTRSCCNDVNIAPNCVKLCQTGSNRGKRRQTEPWPLFSTSHIQRHFLSSLGSCFLSAVLLCW